MVVPTNKPYADVDRTVTVDTWFPTPSETYIDRYPHISLQTRST